VKVKIRQRGLRAVVEVPQDALARYLARGWRLVDEETKAAAPAPARRRRRLKPSSGDEGV